MKIGVVYYSGTGNTEAMADILADALRAKGEVEVFTSADFNGDVSSYDVMAFGCPAMGSEVLEEGEFDPMFTDLEANLAGKKVMLFGSYGWGDGEWMRNWEDRCNDDGATVLGTVICNEAPDDAAADELKALADAI